MSGVSNNLSNASWNSSQINYRSQVETYGAVVIIIALLVISVVGNVIICILIATTRSLRKFTNVIIVNLAVADIGLVVVNVPLSVHVLLNKDWLFSNTTCNINATFFDLFSASALLSCASIAVYRYLQICKHELFSRHITQALCIGEYYHNCI